MVKLSVNMFASQQQL